MTEIMIAELQYITYQSPLGEMRFEAIVQPKGAWALAGVYFDGQKYYPEGSAALPASGIAAALLQSVANSLERYFAGEILQFSCALAPQGTAFQQTVWQALLGVPQGQTISYGELARRLGNPAAVRAAAAAVGRNPISVLIPCHRIVGSNGSLTGYAGGLDRKAKLLALESRPLSL
jgi:methylated-DNA-[protein]-cysteine S-methyltransferase